VLASLKLRGNIVQSDDRRDVKRARQNRRVRCAATQIGRDPEHVCAVHACRVRRSKIMRNENVQLAQGKKRLGSFACRLRITRFVTS